LHRPKCEIGKIVFKGKKFIDFDDFLNIYFDFG